MLVDFLVDDGWLSSLQGEDSWLGCQVLPAVGAVSILELAANTCSRSSRTSWAPILHLSDIYFTESVDIIQLVQFSHYSE